MGDLWFLCEECHNELHQYLKSENLSISGSTKQQKLFRRKMLRLNREPKKKNGKPTDNQIILYNNLCKKLGFIAKRLKTADEYRKAIGIMQRIRANEKGE